MRLRDYLRRVRLTPSSVSSPSKFSQPSAPAPAFNGAFADEVGAVEPPAPVAVPCRVISRAGTLPTKVTRQVAVLAPAVGWNELKAYRAACARLYDSAIHAHGLARGDS